MPKIKNIIIFIAIGAIFVLIYIFYTKASPSDTDTLVSSSGSVATPSADTATIEENSAIAQDFLVLLSSVKNIELDDTIFSDPAFISLHDSSIILIPDGNEGRVNPFAPIGNDVATIIPPTCTASQFLNTTTNTCVARQTCASPKILDTATNTCVSSPPN